MAKVKKKNSKRTRTIVIVSVIVILLAAAGVAAVVLLNGKKEVKPIQKKAAEKPPVEKSIYWPLTGLEAPSEEAIHKRPLSVKIENSPAARPQAGLQEADVVYESISEGGITRFNALFQSQLPEEVGPVRSARLSDATIVPQYGALFAFSGSSSQVAAAIRSTDLPNLSQDVGVSEPYRRSDERYSPHNLYLNIAAAYEEAASRSYEVTADVKPLDFDHAKSEEATSVVSIVDIPFSTANNVTWNWDSVTKSYLRINDGQPFIDATTGNQISAKNVIVLWANYAPAGINKGAETWDITLTGSGDASVFINGGRYDGTWNADTSAPPRFIDKEGTEILLTPGNTWFQVVPTNTQIESK